MHLVGDGEELLKQAHNDVLRWIALCFLAMAEHLTASVEQEQAKETQYPLELLYRCCASKDKDAAQDQGTEDAPEQYFVLVFAFNTEEREQHEEHEEVVHRERFLDEIACQKLHCLLVRLYGIEQIDASTKYE